MRKILIAVWMLIASPIAAMAQTNSDTYFYTPGGGGVNGGLGMCLNGTNPKTARAVPCSDPTALPNTVVLQTANGQNAIVPVIAGSSSSGVVLKASAGNLYGVYAVCTAACWLMIFNSATVPGDGATTAGAASGNMQDCIPIPSGQTGSINYNPGPPEVFSVGISAAISSTACATKTAATTGFIHGSVQ